MINKAARFKKSTALIYVNAIIFFPFLILAFSGLLLQHSYHLEHMLEMDYSNYFKYPGVTNDLNIILKDSEI